MFYNTPRLPRALLHPVQVIEHTTVKGPGGQSRPVEKAVSTFQGVVMPLSDRDWKMLPEGTYTKESQKLYTDDKATISPGMTVRDTHDGQRYTVKIELNHNSIHPMRRFIVEGVAKK